jgi:glycine/D-amino acid oxidase-like deaminating enzyme/nitrite reductase/ring-hydroxylating ferredoxin subunit
MQTLPAPGPLWLADTPAPGPAPAAGPLPARTDVVVVGAGIAGLTTACLLARRGYSTVVIEARAVGAGITGHTTAKITAQHSLVYDHLRRSRGPETAAAYGQAQLEALEWIASEVRQHRADCAFERRHSYVYTADESRKDELAAEADAAQEAGLPAEYLASLDLPVHVVGAVRFADQAQFHPYRWLLHLASQIGAAGGSVHERVRVTNVRQKDGALTTETSAGEIASRHVVITTHYPILDRGLFFSRLNPTRDLVVHGRVPVDAAPEGMYISVDDGHSVRTAPADAVDPGSVGLIIGGEHYRPGARVDVESRYQRLAGWARNHFQMTSVSHRWSAHDLTTIDRLPYVGRYSPGTANLWVATGFGLWGMTNGTHAGHLVASLVADDADPARASLLDPSRSLVPGLADLARDNAAVAMNLVSGLAAAAVKRADFDDLPADSARVARQGRRIVAAYRSPGGELHLVSGNCTHLGCAVRFNNAERSWDCPCHASRFDVDGSIINGPATEPLPRLDPR